MSSRAIIGTEALRLLRGWKATIYLSLSMVLAVAIVMILATTDANHETPMQNMSTIWPFVSLQMIFCLTIFASDSYSSDAGNGTLPLYILLPQKRQRILLSKLVLPVAWFYAGLAIFSIGFTFVQYPIGFWKLWAAMVGVDSLIFFALLSTTVFISMMMKGMGSTVLVSSILMLYLFIYTFQTVSTFGSVNPFFVGASVMRGLWDGVLDSPLPLAYAALTSIGMMVIAYFVLARKEVSE